MYSCTAVGVLTSCHCSLSLRCAAIRYNKSSGRGMEIYEDGRVLGSVKVAVNQISTSMLTLEGL